MLYPNHSMPIAGYKRTVFEDTPVMQPYLLGVIVSDFVSVSDVRYPRQGVFARYNAIRNGEGNFILEAGFKILKVLESYLETDFALPKIYQVAVPDFAAGAMENYGLVTYKEEKFFYDSRSSPMRQKHEIATVVGHEYGHQFFGNMVSPAWWSYLWMKEGFARYFEYLASDMAYPELRIRETYSVQKMQNAFDLDSLGSSRPMTFYVNTQSEIANVFDNIAYDKGGSIMRMFQHAFGPETFRRALINYLRSKAFQGAHPEDFANAIQQALDNATDAIIPSSITALDILKSWTEQSGYPVLTVSRGSDLQVSLIQERYMLKIMDTKESSWIMPYNFATTKNPNFNTTTDTRWLLTNSTILAAEGWSATDWIIFNKQQTGYYRVNYDERLWNLIIEQLLRNPTVIHNMNRAQLVDDVLNFARSGRLGYDTALRLVAYLIRERDYVPWYAANVNLQVLTRLFSGSPKMEYLKKYLLTSINPVFSELGMVTQPNDDLFARQTREIVSKWACAMGSQTCLRKASEILLESVGSSNLQVDPDLRSSIYCAGLVNASEEIFLAVWNRMQTSKDQAFRTDLIYALGCTENVELMEMFLNTSIASESSGTNYFGQERERVFSAVYRNSRKGTEVALRFFMNNIMKINELYNKGNFGGRAIGSAITGLAKYIVDVELNALFQDLIEKLSEDNLLRDTDILRALEQSSENLQWIRSKGKEIEDWLEMRYPTTTVAPPTTTTTTTTTEEPSTTTSTKRPTTTEVPTTSTTQAASTATPKTTEEQTTSTAMPSTGSSVAYDSTTAEPYVETTTKQDEGGAQATHITLALLIASVAFSFM
ncbi:AAEL012779-PA [Aedes aegypti]|uniref:Aminopeptidase n=1 Tax=Aedes aegypti TaxID=7159 RepID=Q16L30_AEDAE|nr:AAEL012779-PA [Aedes aegypti]